MPARCRQLVGRWEAVAYDTIAANGARVVKTIGDEVMFVGLATRRSRDRARAARRRATRTGCRRCAIGLAAGPVVARDGDFYGPVVNLASRLTEVAAPGEVCVPAALRDELAREPRRPRGVAARRLAARCAASARSRSSRVERSRVACRRVTDGTLCLLQVHAHPDDEASKGAGTTAKYAAEGVHNVLVCCTGGEAGDILNPAVDTPGRREAMHELRMAELRESVRRARLRRRCTCSATTTAACPTPRRTPGPTTSPTRRSTKRSAGSCSIIRDERPQVIITYRDDQQLLPAPRPHPGARDLGARRSISPAIPRRTPTRASRGSR